MTICIIYERPDGCVSVEYPAYTNPSRPKNETDKALRARLKKKTVARLLVKYGPPPSIPHDYEEDDLPSHNGEEGADEYFFEAWSWVRRILWLRGRVRIDWPKALALHMKQIRKARDIELGKIDIPLKKAMEEWLRTETSEARLRAIELADAAQVLRDVPQNFSVAKAQTPNELKAHWPKELPGREAAN